MRCCDCDAVAALFVTSIGGSVFLVLIMRLQMRHCLESHVSRGETDATREGEETEMTWEPHALALLLKVQQRFVQDGKVQAALASRTAESNAIVCCIF